MAVWGSELSLAEMNTVRVCPTLRAECHTCLNQPYVVLVTEKRLCETLRLLLDDWRKLLTLKQEVTDMVAGNGKEKVETPSGPDTLGVSISFYAENYLQLHTYKTESDFHSGYFNLDVDEWDALMQREAIITALLSIHFETSPTLDETLPPIWEKYNESPTECIYIPSASHQQNSIVGECPMPLKVETLREYKWGVPRECVSCGHVYYNFEECMKGAAEDVVRRGLYPDVAVHVTWEDKPRVRRGQLVKAAILYKVAEAVTAYTELHRCEACEVGSGGQWRHMEALNGCMRPMWKVLIDVHPILTLEDIDKLYTRALEHLRLPEDEEHKLRIQHSLDIYGLACWSSDLSSRNTDFDHIFKTACNL